MTEQNPWANIPPQYEGRWGYDYDEKLSTFFVHCGGHRILDAEDSEVAHAVCLAHSTYHPHLSAPAAGGLTASEEITVDGLRRILSDCRPEHTRIGVGIVEAEKLLTIIDRLAASPGGNGTITSTESSAVSTGDRKPSAPMYWEGPWDYQANKSGEGFWIGSDNQNACYVPGYTDHPANIATAQLVAKAPEMMDALIQIIAVCSDNAPDSCNKKMALQFVRDVAAKASTLRSPVVQASSNEEAVVSSPPASRRGETAVEGE